MPDPNATLTQLTMAFHTTADDKNTSTGLSIYVYQDWHGFPLLLGQRENFGGSQSFPNGTTSPWYPLDQKMASNYTLQDFVTATSTTYRVDFHPAHTDRWIFWTSVEATFSDGTTLSLQDAAGLELDSAKLSATGTLSATPTATPAVVTVPGPAPAPAPMRPMVTAATTGLPHIAMKPFDANVLGNINGSVTYAGVLTVSWSAHLIPPGFEITATLMGTQIGDATLDPSHATATLGGSEGGFTAELTVTATFDNREVTWNAELCAPLVGCATYPGRAPLPAPLGG